jgi:hypothetical protein
VTDLASAIEGLQDYDAIERFVTFAEQLDVAADLVRADTLPKARMALVAVDNLADLLLHRHAERVFAAGERSWWHEHRRFTRVERDRIHKDFRSLLKIAGQSWEMAWERLDVVVTAADSPVIRVGHSYRNGVYHEDRHNAALIQPLTILYMQAVGRAFSHSYRPGTAWSTTADRVASLQQFGYSLPDGELGGRMFEFRGAAETVTAEITGKFDVALPPLRTWLADDLVARTVRVARIAVGLLEDGMPDERFAFAFNWTLFWNACGADPEAMALQARREELSSEVRGSSGEDVTSTRDLYEQTNRAYIARWHELQRAFRQPVQWHDIPRVGKRAEKLGSAKSLPSLLERYEQLDREVTSLENGVSGAISSWNSMVSDAEQESRERQ